MLQKEIKVGGVYLATVSGKLTQVRVDAISKRDGHKKETTVYGVTNLTTGRTTTFKSAMKFRKEVVQEAKPVRGAEQRPDPTVPSAGTPASTRTTRPGKPTAAAAAAPSPGDSEPSTSTPSCLNGSTTPNSVKSTKESSSPTSSKSSTQATPDSTPASSPGSVDVKSAESQERPAGLTQYLAEHLQPAKADHQFALTPEQRSILDLAEALYRAKGLRVLVIKAGAGAGKTFELQRLEEILSGRGQYTAFNKSLVVDSTPKFKKAACNTTYSLAYRQVGFRYKKRLDRSKRLRSDQVARILELPDFQVSMGPGEDGKDVIKVLSGKFLAGQVLMAVSKFCQSADKSMGKGHFRYVDGIDLPTSEGKRTYKNNESVKEHLLPFAEAAWKDLCEEDGQLPFGHAHYVKMWQLGEGKDKPVINADYILLDEYQDTAPVLISILQQQTHAMLVLVGDDNQRIYEWMGAVNAGDEFPEAPVGTLSQSFRFGQVIADVANSVLSRLEEPTKLVMSGNPTIPSRVGVLADPDCVLSRTNAAAVSAILSYNKLNTGKKGHLIGGGADFVRFVQGALDLKGGRSTDHPELACFASWQEVEEYSKLDEGADLKLNVKLIKEFGCEAIIEALKNMPDEKDAGMIACTAHKSKGREWKKVKLAGDFPLLTKMVDSDVRLLYVAATRAKHVLDVSSCPPFCGGVDRGTNEGGDRDEVFIPGLKIAYTVPMPTEEELATYLSEKGEKKETTELNSFERCQEAVAAGYSSDNPPPANWKSEQQPKQSGEAIFTWSKDGDKWVIRGPKGFAGKKVKVTKKNGQVSHEALAKVIKEFTEACLYEAGRR